MYVEQAIFTSARTKKFQGYHLVAQSPGIEESVARALTKWCPSHGALVNPEPDGDSLNFHPLDGEFVLSRTMYGGPEYSERGGLQVVTRAMLLQRGQLAGYDDNPLLLAEFSLAQGHLRFDANMPPELEPLDLPAHCAITTDPGAPTGDQSGMLGEVIRVLSGDKRLCVVGIDNPLPLLTALFARTSRRSRTELSFTTALKPSRHRPVRLQFLPSIDAKIRHQLSQEKVEILSKPN